MNEAHPGNHSEPEGDSRPDPIPGTPSNGPLDPEQLRQFEQFQQFQNFLRYTQAQQQSTGGDLTGGAIPPAHNPYGPHSSTPNSLAPHQQALIPLGQPNEQPSSAHQAGSASAHYGQVVHQPGQSFPGGQGATSTSLAQQPWPQGPQGPQTTTQPNTSPTQAKPSLPRIRLPRWARKILAKILSIILLIVALVIAGNLAYNHFFPSSGNNAKVSIQSGGETLHTNDALPPLPYESVRAFYAAVAQNDAQRACGAMDAATQLRFAADFHAPDCRQAVNTLTTQVTNAQDYAQSIPAEVSLQGAPSTLDISSCAFEVKGGPSLGRFTTTLVKKGQWLIVGHQNEPTPCSLSSPSTSSTPSTSVPR